MGELLNFMMRLHGSSAWDEIVTDTDKQVVVVSATIGNPKVKTDTVDINTYDGVLDFSSVQGIHYGNRYIKVSLRKINGSTYDFDALRRKYLGQVVDCRFETTSGYYYYGRLTAIEDDYQQDFRTITLTIDANPFRQPVSGATTVEIPVHNTSDLMPFSMTGNNTSSETDVTGSVIKYKYAESSRGGHDISMSIVGTATKGYLYLTITGLASGRKYKLVFKGTYGNCYITIRNGSKTGQIIGESEIRRPTTFNSPSGGTIVLVFTTLSSNASFMSVSLSLAQSTKTHIDNGDRVVSPTYLPRGYNINVEVSDGNRIITSTVLKANTSTNPYFIIPRGGADILATAEANGTLEIEYTKELL